MLLIVFIYLISIVKIKIEYQLEEEEMINCPECKELIGDDVRECPFCYHILTEKEIATANELAKSLHESSEEEMIAEYRKKRNRDTCIIIGYMLVFILTLLGGLALDYTSMLPVLIAVEFIIFIILIFIFRINFCPYCDMPLGRSALLSHKHCPHCGGRLR